jgi:gliding motility-associated-like protein
VIKGLEAFPENEITIFNRWGATVYHKTSYQNNWNGTSENSLDIGGDNLPVGTYFYVLDLHVEGKDILKGYIFLQR